MGFGIGKIKKMGKMAKSLRSSGDGERSWDFSCELLDHSNETAAKGKLRLIRKWKDSFIIFESKEQTLEVPLNNFEFLETEQERKRLGRDYKDRYLSLRFTNDSGNQQDYKFNIPNRKLDGVFNDLDNFVAEFQHEGKTITMHSESGTRDIFLNLFDPNLHADQGEQKSYQVGVTGESSKQLVVTNFRVFYYDEDKDQVINPITYPIQCHVENERTEQITEGESTNYPAGEGFIGGLLAPKNRTKSKTISVTVGDVVIFYDGQLYTSIGLQNPKDLETRINNFSKLFS